MDNYNETNSLYAWVHDDITWCANECSNVNCERNIINRLTRGGYYSAAYFRDTDYCPLKKGNEKHD